MKVIHHAADGTQNVTKDTGSSGLQGEGRTIADYEPLIALVGVSLVGAFALVFGHGGGMQPWMHYFMGLFLCQFALVKLFDIKGFANGFAKYDLLGAKSRGYALSYPFIELALGLFYLSFFSPVLTYLLTIAVLGFGALGVVKALKEGKDLECACMGNILHVPLSHVTLGEDIGMAVMALFMLIF